MLRKRWFRWLIPGLNIKRWLTLFSLGVGLLIIGISLMFNYQWLSIIEDIVLSYSYTLTGFYNYNVLIMVGLVLIIGGVICMLIGTSKVIKTVMRAVLPDPSSKVSDIIFQNIRLDKGPKIVVIGGGTGLSNLLRGLKAHTSNLSAIVTVADDGGSSGRLRKDFQMIAPGDLRNCLVALAEQEGVMENLFRYRFEGNNELSGHSFGNLFITALAQVYDGDVEEALEAASKLLRVRGRVIPSSTELIKLSAEMMDGSIVDGESNIPHSGKPIRRVFSTPTNPKPEGAALQAIDEADVIILGPGSLYTSIIPNLLTDKIADHVRASKANKIYIANVMTQPGETSGYSLADHVQAIIDHSGVGIIDTVLANDGPLPIQMVEQYSAVGSEPVVIDSKRLKEMGIRTVRATLISADKPAIHDPDRLGKVLMDIVYAMKTDMEPRVLEYYLQRSDH
ncbi:gluconeogenesis factor YvcK family protein [Veillonella caviae]|uniref:gluconeogenesis factor YvcK family protein n=1 Tax=Veillonella caviae TaxID=248316 RepID=UPI0023A7A580|nr:gluconeogenesis factor YvcK family protein [Veillonella caviae]MCI5708818.1 YvcK family protein [Veillonella caviae]MCI7693451.1 YvcK family protein [Veillonella caviae]MDD7291883.1 YvcK family protein [Veillonella caviae]MDY5254411.1 gluconeogenesis factor YvcK family protein [Veillonella caviae]MDY5716077.1 gluconeogenesis factor YvcK family protein [Veillonella caviae]